MYNEYDAIEELKRRSKEKGLELSDEMIKADLRRIAEATEGLSIQDRIRKLAKMLQEEE